MTHSFDGWNYVLVLKKGEELLECLQKFVAETELKAGWIQAIGGALEVELGYYELDAREYKWQTFAQLCEIVSLQGNIAQGEKGMTALHLHGTFADETYQTIGGHVNKMIVGGTCEVFIQEFRQPLERQFDDETGLKLLQL